jgi:hypothetical protein
VPAFSRTEAIAASAVCFPALLIVLAYLGDAAGLPVAPFALLVLSLAGSAVIGVRLGRQARWNHAELLCFAAVIVGVSAWIMSLAYPAWLPMGGGADLIHHLQLIDYIERNGHLVRDPAVEAYLGEMSHYTPGSHLLAVLAGAWIGSDGFHAYHLVLAVTVALKAGIVFLIARRLLPEDVPSVPLSAAAVVLLLLPLFYVVGSFTRYSYFAQVVSELFAVAMWWATTMWAGARSYRPTLFFGLWGAAAFLTWPIWIGPPVLALAAVVLLSRPMSLRARVVALLAAVGPILVVAGLHARGRLGWLGIAQTGAEVRLPRFDDFGLVFVTLAVAGLVAGALRKQARPLTAFAAAILAQTIGLYMLAASHGAQVPYMAIKMIHLALYPAVVAGTLACAETWRAVARTRHRAWFRGVRAEQAAWIVAALAAALAVPHVARMPRQPPTVSESLYEAGRWARANLPAECVDYLVSDELTAYWLHLAVLGSRRISARTADNRTFMPREAILRWILPGGLPFAVADLDALPRDIRDGTDQLARFGNAVVIERRGPSGACGR